MKLSLMQIKKIVAVNKLLGKRAFYGLSVSDIARYQEWSRIVD